jgi:NitT/TauT family transport system substrate-binding protein
MLEERPETVKNFSRALLQGWQEILKPANEEKAINTVLKYNKETPEEIVRQQLPATRILMMPTPDFEFGKIDQIDPAAWKQTEEIMLSQKLIPVPVFVEKLLKPVAEK